MCWNFYSRRRAACCCQGPPCRWRLGLQHRRLVRSTGSRTGYRALPPHRSVRCLLASALLSGKALQRMSLYMVAGCRGTSTFSVLVFGFGRVRCSGSVKNGRCHGENLRVWNCHG